MLILVARKWSFRSQGHKASWANCSNVLYTNLGQEHCVFPQMHKKRNKATIGMLVRADFFFFIVIKSHKLNIFGNKALQSPSTTARTFFQAVFGVKSGQSTSTWTVDFPCKFYSGARGRIYFPFSQWEGPRCLAFIPFKFGGREGFFFPFFLVSQYAFFNMFSI